MGDFPFGVAVHPDGSRVYVANWLSQTVSVIDTATNTVVKTVAVGDNPVGVAVHPDGSRVYVANEYSHTVSVIDTATNTVVKTVSVGVGSFPFGVTVHPDGSRVYVANEGSGGVSVIDTATNTVVKTVTVGDSLDIPFGVAVHPDGSRVYVANEGSHTVAVIDTATNTVIATVAVEVPVSVAVHPDGSRVYVANVFSHTVSVIDTATNTVVKTVAVGEYPFGVAVHPDGSRVYVANQVPGTVSVIDTATNTVVETVQVGTSPIALGNFIGPAATPALTAPTGLTATVGNAAVYLKWASPAIPVDGYNIFVERFDANTKQFIPLGTVNPSGILIKNSSFKVLGFANGQLVENSKLYRFTVQAVENGLVSGLSNHVLARPGTFGVGVSQPPSPPDNPILFLHGIFSDASTWESTVDFFTNTLNWKFGGTYTYSETDDPRFENPVPEMNVTQGGIFYTANFGNSSANYNVGRPGLLHQADEVQGFIRGIRTRGETRKLIIVAHSMGGMAARSYIADQPGEAVREIAHFITYGSPHWGALFTSGVQLISRGARDLDYDCTNGRLDYSGSPFFEHLRRVVLPSGIARYSFIRGAVFLQNLTPCLSKAYDGVIPTNSADLGHIPPTAPLDQYPLVLNPDQPLTTDRFHDQETSDFAAILCALDPTRSCLKINVMSPVDIEVVAPDGRSIAVDLVEIPGASYVEPLDDTGHSTATVIVPFPIAGNYAINVVPKPGALPTDTYTIEVTQKGETVVLAQNQQIQNIPSQGYTMTVPKDLKSLAPAKLWVGLKNSDDQGTFFDVRVEVLKNGSPIASGVSKNIQGVTRNPDMAKEVTVAFGSISDGEVSPGDILSLKVFTKVADSGGHNNAVGLRLYYDAVTRPSRFGAEITPDPLKSFFLRTVTSDFLDSTALTGKTPKQKDSPGIDRKTYREIGTWSMTVQ